MDDFAQNRADWYVNGGGALECQGGIRLVQKFT